MQTVTAKEIYQSRLDALSHAILSGDMDQFVPGIHLPYTVQTHNEQIVYHTESELRDGISRYSAELKRKRVTRLIRTCESAAFRKPDEIEGFNNVQLFVGDQLAVDPYLVRMRMVRDAISGWRVSYSCATIQSSDWPILPIGSTRLEARSTAPADEDAVRLASFQTYLDRLDQILLTGDYDGWQSVITLPVTFIHRKGAVVIDTPKAARDDFDLYMAEFRVHRVDNMLRQATSVHQISQDQRVGTYKTYILRGAELVVPAYESSMTLQKGADGLWRMTSVMNALGHLNWKNSEGQR